MFAWLNRFVRGGDRLSQATEALAQTFEELNRVIRQQTGLDGAAPALPISVPELPAPEAEDEPARSNGRGRKPVAK